MKEVEKWYEDYLRLLYRHIEFKLNPELLRTSWHNAKIEFIFSVPTTWKPPTVEKFRAVAERAGFSWCAMREVELRYEAKTLLIATLSDAETGFALGSFGFEGHQH